MQILLVMETRSSCESDYRYIKSAIDYYYVERSFKLTKIYAKTKAEIIHQNNKINDYTSRYSGKTVVVICADYDRELDSCNKMIIDYCAKNNYELVWMNLDVEEVFLGRQVANKDKNKESLAFLKKMNTYLSDIKTLNNIDPLAKHPASNLLVVLDKYLKRKT